MGNHDDGVAFDGETGGCEYTNPELKEWGDTSFRWSCAEASGANQPFPRSHPSKIGLARQPWRVPDGKDEVNGMGRQGMKPQSRAMLDEGLKTISSDVLQMSELVRIATSRAVQALESHDHELAARVVEGDTQVNDLRFKIESACVSNIARQQPAARDLRDIVAAMSIVLDLERIGDHAAGIAKTVLRAGELEPGVQIPPSLFTMRDLTTGMIRDVMAAYESHDIRSARAISERDDEVDQRYRVLFRELLQEIPGASKSSEYGLHLLFAGHNLERIADRVTNIAERVIFAASGMLEELNVDEQDQSGIN